METVSAHRLLPRRNDTAGGILLNALLAAVSLFVNGFGVYLTIQANIGAGPWDVLNLGVSRSLETGCRQSGEPDRQISLMSGGM